MNIFLKTEENEEHFKNKIFCQICVICLNSDKGGDHCHSTGKNRGRVHNKCKINVT